MDLLMRIAGAMIFTYFLSRLALRLPNPLKGVLGTVLAHAVSLAAISLLVMAMRSPLDVFRIHQLLIFVIAQGVWLAFDVLRGTFPRRAEG